MNLDSTQAALQLLLVEIRQPAMLSKILVKVSALQEADALWRTEELAI